MTMASKLALGMALALLLAVAHAEAATVGQEAVAWRAARWGMSQDEVVKAFPGEAKPLEKPIVLPDGNVVAVGIDEHVVASTKLQVRFVFDSAKLALVSLRSPEKSPATPDTYVTLAKHLAKELGGPGEETKDDNFVDMRQTRWNVGGTRIDLKYIPGVVVILYSPLSGS